MGNAYLRTGEHICEQAYHSGFCWVCGKKMRQIYETDDGLKSESAMYWDFIKSMKLTDEYKLWHKAIVKKNHVVHD